MSVPQSKNVIYGLHHIDEPDRIRYVGQTRQTAKRRFWHHQGDARAGSTWPVHAWMRKHGLDHVTYRILEVCGTPEDLDARERAWISKLQTRTTQGGLNLTDGGAGASGWKAPDASRANMSASVQKRKWQVADKIRGSKASNAILNEEMVRVAKELMWEGYSPAEVADLLGVSAGALKQVSRGGSWTHVPWPIGPRRKPRRNRHREMMTGANNPQKGKVRTPEWSEAHARARARLADGVVRDIRRLRGDDGKTYREIKEMLGLSVSIATVRKVALREAYSYIPDEVAA